MKASKKHSRKVLESGIVRLKDLEDNPHPDRFHAWCPLCIKKQKELKGTLKLSKEAPEQILLEHRLKAGVSKASWEAKRLREWITLSNGEDYKRWMVSEFRIIEGIPFLNFIRSLSSRKKQLLYPMREPWILVDFYEDGKLSR